MSSNRPADIVLTGGAIQTMDSARSWARALAVRGDLIAAVGRDEGVSELVGPRTRVIDLRDRMVTPGFQDSHIHPVTSGVERRRCDLTDSRGLPRYLELRTAARSRSFRTNGSICSTR
jgi:predicted amidohydrolase YtcJ